MPHPPGQSVQHIHTRSRTFTYMYVRYGRAGGGRILYITDSAAPSNQGRQLDAVSLETLRLPLCRPIKTWPAAAEKQRSGSGLSDSGWIVIGLVDLKARNAGRMGPPLGCTFASSHFCSVLSVVWAVLIQFTTHGSQASAIEQQYNIMWRELG